jgi:hypothetical protein
MAALQLAFARVLRRAMLADVLLLAALDFRY